MYQQVQGDRISQYANAKKALRELKYLLIKYLVSGYNDVIKPVTLSVQLLPEMVEEQRFCKKIYRSHMEVKLSHNRT